MPVPSSEAEDHSSIPKIELPAGGFKSDIPPHLLAGKDEGEIWVLECSSKMNNFIEWAGPILVNINKQQRVTNGRVNLHDSQIIKNTRLLEDLEIHSKDAREVITTAKFVINIFKNKYFWIGVGALLIVTVPVVVRYAPGPDVVIKKILGL